MRGRKSFLRVALAGSVGLGACNGAAPAVTGETSALTSDSAAARPPITESPIKHVVVIVGENRTFDHVFATYKAAHGQHVDNLLSKGIVKDDGSPGPRFERALQKTAVDEAPHPFDMSPGQKKPYKVLPPALAGGPTTPFVPDIATAKAIETGLPDDYYVFATTGGTGLASGAIDTRLPNATKLPPGPFQLTPHIPYDAYAASPVHRFYQMWQQLDCSFPHATFENPSGCEEDLFPWVEVSVGAGANGADRPADFSDLTTGEGSTAMGFYNVQQGDAPYFKLLADTYTMSDNFHQSIEGGTGANHVALGTGDAVWYSDGKGGALTPPMLNTENPNPAKGTNNWYAQDGYSGGTYSNCADDAQPGVGSVNHYLHQMHVNPNCDKGHYYLLNNYAPGYFGDGSVNDSQFAIPPSSVRNIGDELMEHDISWRYYGAQWNLYLKDPDYTNPANDYCDICNPVQYATSIMANAARSAPQHIHDHDRPGTDIASGRNLPAVSIVKAERPRRRPPGVFEACSLRGILEEDGRPHPEQAGNLWKDTAIIGTFDEGGGLLQLQLRVVGRLLRRRHAHPHDRDLALLRGRLDLARVRRSRVGAEVHRAQLAPAPAHAPQPRQPAEPDHAARQPVRADQRSGHR